MSDGRDIGAEMIDKGLAWAFVKYSDAYIATEELVSKDKAFGVFGRRIIQTPWEFRELRVGNGPRHRNRTPRQDVPSRATSAKNGRIYHAPWSPWYGRTRINASERRTVVLFRSRGHRGRLASALLELDAYRA